MLRQEGVFALFVGKHFERKNYLAKDKKKFAEKVWLIGICESNYHTSQAKLSSKRKGDRKRKLKCYPLLFPSP